MAKRNRRQVAFAVVLLVAAGLFLARVPTVAMLLLGLFLVWWVLAIIRDLGGARAERPSDR